MHSNEPFAVETFVVPGNHDIDFKLTARNREDIKTLLNGTISSEIINDELKNFEKFFNFSSYYKCFLNNKIIDIKHISCCDKKIQINLINSELFSSFADKNNDNDKGLHYLPEYEVSKLKKQKGIDYVLTVSHRGPEWFDWQSENSLKQMLYCHSDIFLYGHEHIRDISVTIKRENYLLKSINNPVDFITKNISYSTLLLDTELNKINTASFSWNGDDNVFVRISKDEFPLEQNRNEYNIQPSTAFLERFGNDEKNLKINSYFVFSGVEVYGENKYENITEYNDFLSAISHKKTVVIEGYDLSGKTLLLKQLYLSFIGSFIPLFIDEELLSKTNIEKVIKAAFEEQYGSKATDFEKFVQLDNEKKLVLVDNLDKIPLKHAKKIQDYLNENFGIVIFTTQEKWDYDLVNEVKNRLKEKTQDFAKYRILPFYSQKRLQLIERIFKIHNDDEDVIKSNAKRINDFIREQVKLFSLNPQFIHMYVNYYTKNAELESGVNNIFGKVFEHNLINSIKKFASENDIDEFTVLLEEIAYNIHFEEKYPISLDNLLSIVKKYNHDTGNHVNFRIFCDVMIKSKILKENEDSFSFYNNNYLAYFVAKSLNAKLNNGEDKDKLLIIMKNICFNINGDILLFLSYITSNLSILRFIRENAEQHMKDWLEFDIDKKNIGFVNKSTCPPEIKMPTHKDRMDLEKREEDFEKKAIADEKIKKINLYDYDRNRIDTESYKLGQALRYTELICKILPGFSHRLLQQDKSSFVKNIFEYPNRIIYKFLRNYDLQFEKIVLLILEFCKENQIDVSEHDIKYDIIKSAETFILNTYDIFARLSVSNKTVSALRQFNAINTNSKIQWIMMLENLGAFNEFALEADKIFDTTKSDLVKSMVARVVQKHFLCHKELKIYGEVERVARKYFGKSFRKTDLLKK